MSSATSRSLRRATICRRWPSTTPMWHWWTYSATDCRMCCTAAPAGFGTGETSAAVCWTGLASLTQIPAGIALAQPGVGFGDMGGDGQADLLVHSGPLPGFFETTSDGTWQTFKPYDVFPSFDLADPNVRLVDLTGDGLSDALMTQGEQFPVVRMSGRKGVCAAASHPAHSTISTTSRMSFSMIPREESAWPT